MPNADPNDEKESLVQGYVEGLLSPAEMARLRELIRQDPTLARLILENMRMDGAIRDLVGEREKGMAALVPPPPETPGPRKGPSDPASSTARLARVARSKDTRRFQAERPNRMFAGLLAAACLLIAIGVTLVSTTGPTEKEREAKRIEEARRDLDRRKREAEERLARINAAEEAHQQRLVDLSKERETLTRPPVEPAPVDPAAEANRVKRIAELDAERERLERDMIAEIARAESAEPEIETIPEPVKEPAKTQPGVPAAAPTITTVARIDRIEGLVYMLSGDGQKKVISEPGDLLADHGLETAGAGGRAALVFRDKSRIEMGAETVIQSVKVNAGKRIHVGHGVVRSDVSRQPKGQPMIFVTPHAEATVLGTSLRIIVIPGEAGRTTLEVREGKVELKRIHDGKTVTVSSGQYAIAAAGAEPVAVKPIAKSLAEMLLDDHGFLMINFGPDGIPLPDSRMLNDSAKKFDAGKGFGWVEGPPSVWAGISPTPKDRVKADYVAGGTLDKTVTWRMPIRNGRYHVAVAVGGVGATFPDQGPHHVVVEGKLLFDTFFTRNGAIVESAVAVVVHDEELTMEVGGSKGKVKCADNSDDTILIYMIIKKAN